MGVRKIVSWNVNGFRSIQQKGWSQFVQEVRPDILCIQESRISRGAEATASIDVELFCAEHHSCALKKGYSGVATFVADEALKPAATYTLNLGHDVIDNEGRLLVTDHGWCLLYNAYFPSGTTGDERQQVKYEFLALLYEHLRSLSAADRGRLVLCGDFNICHADHDIHHPREAERRRLSGFLPEERQWLSKIIDLGFTDSYRYFFPAARNIYSWWTYRAGARGKNLGWRIDYILVGKSLRESLSTAGILTEVLGSDHCPVYIELEDV